MSREPDYEQVNVALDELFSRLTRSGGSSREARRLLAEAESHLKDATDEAVADGMTSEEAQRHALARFGSVEALSAGTLDGWRRPLVPLVVEAVDAFWRLVWIGLLSVAASGAVAAAMVAAVGRSFVFGAPPGTPFLASQCSHWLAVQPQAHSCAQAQLAESYDDAMLWRGLAGVLALAVFGLGVVMRRRVKFRRLELLPDGFASTIGVTIFGATGVYLIGFGIDQVAIGKSDGSGQWLSAGLCAAAVAIFFLTKLVRAVLMRATALPV